MWSSIGKLILTIPAGVLADRYGMKRIMVFGLTATGVAMILILLGKTTFTFSIAWMILGVSSSTGALIAPLYSSLFNHDDLDRAFGLYGFINIASTAIGSLFGLIPPFLVLQANYTLTRSYWLMLVVCAVFYAIQLPIFLNVLNSAEIPHSKKKKSSLSSHSVVIKFSFLYIIQNLAYGAFFGLFPFYVNTKYGVGSDALGVLFFVVQLVQAAVNVYAPKIADKEGSVKTVSVALAATVPFWLLFIVAPAFWWVSIVYIVIRAISAVSGPLVLSLFYRLLFDDEKATANSLTQTTSMVSNIIAPKLGGHMMENVHIESTAVMGAGLYAVYSFLFYLFLRNEEPKRVRVLSS